MKKLEVVVDFDTERPEATGVLATLTYDDEEQDCPDLSIEAHLDGVRLADSPNSTGRVSEGCQVGFFLIELPPPAAPESTIRFREGSAQASFGIVRLLEPHYLMSAVPDRPVLTAGDRVTLTWSVDSDEISALDAFFVREPEAVQVEPELDAQQVTVTTPSLASGDWMLSLGVVAQAAVVDCVGAPLCKASIFGDSALPVTVE
ncbi:MAG TPA: hypothetical protein VJN18_24695 [Polyangiaceae bacterium]|nr:hypothetical protein [Polyangiaceae bacterium]